MNNGNNGNQNSGMTGAELPFLIMLLVGAGLYKYGHSIQVWFHENVVTLTFFAMAIVVIGGFVVVSRIQKKNQDQIDRVRRLNAARSASSSVDSYYKNSEKNQDQRGRDL